MWQQGVIRSTDHEPSLMISRWPVTLGKPCFLAGLKPFGTLFMARGMPGGQAQAETQSQGPASPWEFEGFRHRDKPTHYHTIQNIQSCFCSSNFGSMGGYLEATCAMLIPPRIGQRLCRGVGLLVLYNHGTMQRIDWTKAQTKSLVLAPACDCHGGIFHSPSSSFSLRCTSDRPWT